MAPGVGPAVRSCDGLMDPVGGGPQPDLGMLFVDLAEGLITRRAVGQLVVGKAVIP